MPDNTPLPKITIQYSLDRGKGSAYEETCKLALCEVCQKPLWNTRNSSIYVGATVQVSDYVVLKEKREDPF